MLAGKVGSEWWALSADEAGGSQEYDRWCVCSKQKAGTEPRYVVPHLQNEGRCSEAGRWMRSGNDEVAWRVEAGGRMTGRIDGCKLGAGEASAWETRRPQPTRQGRCGRLGLPGQGGGLATSHLEASGWAINLSSYGRSSAHRGRRWLVWILAQWPRLGPLALASVTSGSTRRRRVTTAISSEHSNAGSARQTRLPPTIDSREVVL